MAQPPWRQKYAANAAQVAGAALRGSPAPEEASGGALQGPPGRQGEGCVGEGAGQKAVQQWAVYMRPP